MRALSSKLFLTAFIFAYFSTSSFAEQPTFYISAGIGTSKFPLHFNDTNYSGSGSSYIANYSSEDTGRCYDVMLGARFHRYYGVELERLKLGQMKYSEVSSWQSPTYSTDAVLNFRSSYSGFTIGHVGFFPLGPHFLLTGKIGAYALNLETNNAINQIARDSGGSITSQSSSDTKGLTLKTGGFYGFGLSVLIHESVDLRVRWERFNSLLSKSSQAGRDVDRMTFDVIYKL